MEQRELRELLNKEAENQLNDKNQQALDRWYDEFDENGHQLTVFKDQVHEKQVYFRLLNRIHALIPDAQPETGFKKLRPVVPGWLKVAAVLAIFSAGVPLYFYLGNRASQGTSNAFVLVSANTGVGKMKELTLEDGSVVTLNSATKLSYPKHFKMSSREVYLDGEAFFKVSHNPKKPFIVHSGPLSTTVLGTSFNIRAYKGIDVIKVNVATGKVGIASKAKKLGLLLPDQAASYDQKNEICSIVQESAGSAISWKQGRIKLDGVSFEELAIVLENTYGYQLKTERPAIKRVTFKISFNSYDPVETVMKIISRIPDSKFSIKDKRIIMY